MMKVLLLNPPTDLLLYKEDRCQNEIESHLHRIIRPPISLMGLAAISEDLGFQTKIIDSPIEKVTLKELFKFLNYWRPHWVIVNTSLETLQSDLISLQAAKEVGANTIVFGYAPTLKDKEILESSPFIDYAIRGEPEKTFQELIQSIIPLKEIEGLTFRENNTIKRNPDRPFIDDLDELPFPTHHLIQNNLYRVPTSGKIFTTIQTSRGCPHHCIFCLTNRLNGSKVRKRSVNNIIKEIQVVVQKYNIRNFFFRADTFTFDKEWVMHLCREIIRNDLKITWFCNSRVDTVDQEMLKVMRRAGCQLITFGVESGNERTLKAIKKGITKDQAKQAILTTRKTGILTGAFYILGLPSDTINTIHETIQFSKDVDSDGAEYIPFIPFLGTEAISFPSTALDPSTIQKLTQYALIKYYFRPKIILRYLYNFYLKPQGLSSFINLLLATLKTIIHLIH